MILALTLAALTLGTGYQDPVEASSRRGRSPATPPAVQIQLKNSALVRGTQVLIGDLATITPPGPLATHIAGLEFGNPPAHGFVRRATPQEIRNRLAAQGVDLSNLQLTGPSSTSIQATYREVKVTELRDVADAVLNSVLRPQPGEEIEFDLEQAQKSIRVPPGRKELEYQARVREGSITENGAIVDVTFLVDGLADKKLAMRYRVDRYQFVVKTARSIRAGEPLDSGSLVRSREKISATRGFYATEPSQLAGLVARRDLPKDRMVSIHDGQEPKMIRAGDLIEVIASRGNVEISMSAKALTDGSRGESITVQNLSSDRQFSAQVFAPGIAVVGRKR